MTQHADIMTWNYFPHYWHFVRGIHRSPVDSPLTRPVMWNYDFSLLLAWISCLTNSPLAGDFLRYATALCTVVAIDVNRKRQATPPLSWPILFVWWLPVPESQPECDNLYQIRKQFNTYYIDCIHIRRMIWKGKLGWICLTTAHILQDILDALWKKCYEKYCDENTLLNIK